MHIRDATVQSGVSFLAGAHRELSVALIKCQESVYRGCANLMARAACRQVSPGAEVLTGVKQGSFGPCVQSSSRSGVALTSSLPCTFSLMLSETHRHVLSALVDCSGISPVSSIF